MARWIDENHRPKSWQFKCSECGEIAYYPQSTHEKYPSGKKCGYKYCPNCGVKMADRKTEPQKICKYCNGKCSWWVDGDCMNDDDCRFKPKTEPQTEVSAQEYERWLFKEPKTEPFAKDINVRSKDEPQTERSE